MAPDQRQASNHLKIGSREWRSENGIS
jgi:hypothetical protein